MLLKPGYCLKCGKSIMINNKPSSNWKQKGFELASGNIMLIALCVSCDILPEEFGKASRALNLESPIVKGTEIEDRLEDVLKDAQGGVCHFCRKPIGEKYVISGGYICCERC